MTKITMETVSVDSSLVSFMTYHKISNNLYVTFKNGNVYLYSNVDNATYEDVRNSESIGKALHKEVFGVFKYQKLNNKVSVKYPERLIKRKNSIT